MESRHLFWRFLYAAAALLLFTGAAPARPQASVTITVNTTADEISNNGNCSLREAILAANTNHAVDGCTAGSTWDIIRMPSGTFNLKIAGIDEDLGRTGDLDLASNIKIVGAGKEATVIDGQELDRVIHVTSETAATWLDNLTVRNGYLHGYYIDGPQKFNPGGGIYNTGRMILTRVEVIYNRISSGPVDTEGGISDGGGIYNAGTLTAVDTLISHNETDLFGAGVTSPGKITFTRVEISHNTGYYSSGLQLGDSVGNVIRDSRIVANGIVEPWGDGVSALALSGDGELLVEDTVISSNAYTAIDSDGKLTLNRVTVSNSHSATYPAIVLNGPTLIYDSSFLDNDDNIVLMVAETSATRIERSTFANPSNSPEKGNGIVVNGGQLKLYNSTITGTGGAQVILVRYGKLTLEADTIADNDVTDRGLVVTGGTLIMHNTILANTRDAETGALTQDCLVAPGTTTSQGYNILGNVDGCGWPIQPTDQHAVNNAHIDPMLGALRKNGGLTATRALLPGSTAIDRGDPQVYMDTDQRGVPRPVGDRIDIGAYELSAPPFQAYLFWAPYIPNYLP